MLNKDIFNLMNIIYINDFFLSGRGEYFITLAEYKGTVKD